jgi:hypothetical protein
MLTALKRGCQNFLDALVFGFEVPETSANGRRNLEIFDAVIDDFMEPLPTGETLFHRANEKIGYRSVIVFPVALMAHSLDKALLLEKTRVYAGTRLACPSRNGNRVKRQGMFAKKQKCKNSSRDPRKPVRFKG